MTDDRRLEDEAVFNFRCETMRRELAQVHADLVSVALTDLAGDNSQPWADRVYDRLQAMAPKDLALMIVLLLHREATDEANRLWSQLWTTRTAEEIR